MGVKMKRWLQRIGAGAQRWWKVVAARPRIAHLLRAGQRFSSRLGNQFAAAITYFSFLSLVPVLMVSFSAAGFALSSRPDWIADIKGEVTAILPEGQLSTAISSFIDQAVDQRLAVGLVGLAVALYSGLSWMGNVRNALRAQWLPRWGQQPVDSRPIWKQYAVDLLTLGGLAVAILTSVLLTTVGTAAQDLVVGWLNIAPGSVLRAVLAVGPFVVAIVGGTGIFAWIYTMLPPKSERTPRRFLLIGSLLMAVSFEVLKAALTLLVTRMSSSPSGIVFGSVIGLLLFFNLVARVFLFIAAYLATAHDDYAKEKETTEQVAAP